MNSNQEQILIGKCLKLIEQKVGWGDSSNWHSKVFEELSETIQKETAVLLSPTTLKRVWGKLHYNSSPSISTLNTLSKFAGFLNWRDFKSKEEALVVEKIKMPTRGQAKIFGYAAVIAVFFISLFSVISKKPEMREDFDFTKVKFESRPVTLGLPNSVVFNLDLKGLESDSIYIQQYWDVTKTIRLKPGQSQATGQYYFPGYFRAKLLVDGDIKKEHDLFIKSDGWLGTIDYEPIPKYFTESNVLGNNLRLPLSAVDEIKSSSKPLISSLHYVNDLGNISGDNFELNTSVKNLYKDKWAVCQKLSLIVVGTKSAIIIPVTIPGCVSEIGVMLSEKYLSGKEHDLSAFGSDLSVFNDIAIQVKNKTIKVSINDDVKFIEQFNASIGNIVGVRYRFLGAGEVDYLRIKDILSNEFIINTDF